MQFRRLFANLELIYPHHQAALTQLNNDCMHARANTAYLLPTCEMDN